jgi:hypothetical protein
MSAIFLPFSPLSKGAHHKVYAGVVIKYMPPAMPRYIGWTIKFVGWGPIKKLI